MANDSLKTQLCDDFGLEYPVIVFTLWKEVAAAAINAGGLAVLAEGIHPPEKIRADINWMREQVGTKAFGIDLLVPASAPPAHSREELEAQIPDEYRQHVAKIKRDYNVPEPKPLSEADARRLKWLGYLSSETIRQQLDTVLEERVPILASAIGNPAFVMEAAHDRGVKVFGLIGTVRQAVREAEAGVDYIVAQGYDAGGHTGEVGTFSLVPQVVSAVGKTPVIAAGGVGSGRHLVASLAFGAVGVWSGTIWLVTRESSTDPIVKRKILAASERDTIRSRWMTGKPVRQLTTGMTDAWEAPDAPVPLGMPHQALVVRELRQSVDDHKIEALMGTPAGQVSGMVTEERSVKEVMEGIVGEAREVLDSLNSTSVRAGHG